LSLRAKTMEWHLPMEQLNEMDAIMSVRAAGGAGGRGSGAAGSAGSGAMGPRSSAPREFAFGGAERSRDATRPRPRTTARHDRR
jgi:hypothetical protein